MSDDNFDHVALAVAVLRRAVDDVHLKGKYARALRATATAFLLSEDCGSWCDVAGVPTPSMRTRRRIADPEQD